MAHTKRSKFISIEGSYHGHSIGAMSVGSSGFRKWYKNLLPGCHKIDIPLDEVAARKVERLLRKRDIAAFICEPVICNLGVVIPEKKFFTIVQAACKKYRTLFIADEVATGFGRTGKMFACEHYDLKPDILCLAKGVSGGFGALGATVMTPEVAKSFEFDFSFYSTFGWHPLNVEATVASLRYLRKNKKRLFKNGAKLSDYIQKRLGRMDFQHPVKINAKGLAIGVEFGKAGYSNKIIRNCLKNGLLIANATPTNFVIYPALNMTLKTAREGMDILEKCIG
jgi:acetylornithine/succinyldiaminopimelate/putrescine aminotransferase